MLRYTVLSLALIALLFSGMQCASSGLNVFTVEQDLEVYTGLIKYLDSEDELAGVLAHEIAHSARRHSTQQATRQYGIATLLSLVTGQSDPGLLSQIATGLLSLKFSRSHEREADSYSVVYLCPIAYNAAGAAGFFEKMQAQGGGAPPEFLSSQPSPSNRVENIKQQARERDCTGQITNQSRHEQFERSLQNGSGYSCLVRYASVS